MDGRHRRDERRCSRGARAWIGSRHRSALAALTVALTILCSALIAHATARPEPLRPGEGCERWTGNASGNDPTVQLDLELCPHADGRTGRLQWSSLRSGWNIRAVKGRWSEDGQSLTLSDQRIVEDKPQPGWRFCVIDRYALTRRGPDQLQGTYHSKACSDEASVSLRRVVTAPATGPDAGARAPASPSGASVESATSSPASAPSAAPAPGPARGCAGCTLGAHAPALPGREGHGWWPWVLVGCARLRRRA